MRKIRDHSCFDENGREKITNDMKIGYGKERVRKGTRKRSEETNTQMEKKLNRIKRGN